MTWQSWGYRFDVEPVEFVTFRYVYCYLHISSKALRASHILDGIPFRVRSSGRKEYRLSEIKRRLAKFNLYPPDTMHPLHRFQAVDAAREMGVRKIDTYFKRIKEGKITLSTDEQGRRFVYRKDMDKFRRRWMPKTLVEHMLDPLPRRQAAIVLGWSVDYCKALERRGEIAPMPRKKVKSRNFSLIPSFLPPRVSVIKVPSMPIAIIRPYICTKPKNIGSGNIFFPPKSRKTTFSRYFLL